jgi:hypothetical protein
MKTVTIKFRKTSFDVTHDDGIIDSIDYNGLNITGLMFDMGFIGDITTELLETISQNQMESAQLAVEAENNR